MDRIESIIQQKITEVTGVHVVDRTINLLDPSLGISPADFLCIFDSLEKEFLCPIYSIFKSNGVEIMSVQRLAHVIDSLRKSLVSENMITNNESI